MISTIGYIAAILTTLSSLPQVIAIYQTNNVEGLSPYYFGILLSGIILWTIYGILLKAKPIIFANGLSMTMVGYIFIKTL